MAGEAILPPARPTVRSRVVEALCVLLHYSGLLWLLLRFRRLAGGAHPRVLCYHRVARDGREGTLSTGTFSKHLDHLASHYEFLAPSRLVEALLGRGPLPRNVIVLTFDDGYRDLLAEALPELRSRGVVAGFFVLTAHLPGTGTLFLDRLRGTPLEKERRALAALGASERARRLVDLPTDGCPLLMGKGDLTRLVEEGQEVGSHGRSHTLLTEASTEEVGREVAMSREELRTHAAIRTSVFAYPWGASNDTVKSALADSGYVAAFTTSGRPVLDGTEPLSIPRIHVPGDCSVARLSCEASGLLDLLRRLLR